MNFGKVENCDVILKYIIWVLDVMIYVKYYNLYNKFG